MLMNGAIINSNRLLICLLSLHNPCTLVGYPAGYYFDIFKDRQQSLDNKMTFNINLKEEDPNIGRGRCGKRKSVFALLDWTNSGVITTMRSHYIAACDTLPKGHMLTTAI